MATLTRWSWRFAGLDLYQMTATATSPTEFTNGRRAAGGRLAHALADFKRGWPARPVDDRNALADCDRLSTDLRRPYSAEDTETTSDTLKSALFGRANGGFKIKLVLSDSIARPAGPGDAARLI
jgi:hypothetical protein